jgi:hypothetical protein
MIIDKLSSKQTVNIISCNFGSDQKVPEFPQQNGNYEVIVSHYDESNYPSRKNSLHPRLKGKIPRMLNYKWVDADYYIWMDHKFVITSSEFIEWMISNLKGKPIAFFQHYARGSIREELDFMVELINNGDRYLLDRYDGEDMISQVESYLKDDTFIDDKLFATGIFIYTKELIEKHPNILSDWFMENVLCSVQDQLSLPYVLHKHKVDFTIIDSHILYNPYVKYP